jgi:hypothetical protein
MPTPLPTPVVTLTTPRGHRRRTNSAEISMRCLHAPVRFSAATIYLLVCFFLLLSFRHSPAAPRRVHDPDCWCLGTAALKAVSPSFESVPVPYFPAEGNDPGSRQAVYSTRSFPADHAPTHNEHPRYGLSNTSLRSRPIVRRGRHVIASRVARPRRAPTAEDQTRVM